MGRVSQQELTPRNGHTLMVGIGCRISGCAKQKEQSLQDQEDSAKEVIATRNQEKLADWLNERNVPVGKYSRSGRWGGKAVARARRNTLLKG